MLSELQNYLRMDGLALKLVPYRNWKISPDRLERNLVDIYKYRGLQDPSVYYDKNIIGLLQNYRTGFLQLVEYYSHSKDTVKTSEDSEAEITLFDGNVIRITEDSETTLDSWQIQENRYTNIGLLFGSIKLYIKKFSKDTDEFFVNRNNAISGRPQGPYTVKNRRPVVGS